MTTEVVHVVERTTAGLREALLSEIESLLNGKTTEGRANAIARLANSAIATVRLEIDAQMHGAESALVRPLSLAA